MTASTPLDTLKHTVLRVDDILQHLMDALEDLEGVTPESGEQVFALADAARQQLFRSAGEQIPGVRWWDGMPQFTSEGRARLRTYSDGTPVVEIVDHGDNGDIVRWHHYPRLDAWIPTPRRRLRLVGPDEDSDGGDVA